ncbi:LOW QUALITY PROTEIN: hypothetical protein CVT26_015608 [Gymnopilus dilepis]|uniref:Uncharacterized protein n=1 Tax=Gymnopilus dilepis TaxID=231916 RepID=A0A409XYR9_9AGAR|nr:LOW QUALITY PROTEIN: hypothetical protein CVT26_015608 [Gymnopilus dilepis]
MSCYKSALTALLVSLSRPLRRLAQLDLRCLFLIVSSSRLRWNAWTSTAVWEYRVKHCLNDGVLPRSIAECRTPPWNSV